MKNHQLLMKWYRAGKLWIRMSRWGENDIDFMKRKNPEGKLIWNQQRHSAYFRPCNDKDISHAKKEPSYLLWFDIVENGSVRPLIHRKKYLVKSKHRRKICEEG